MAGRRLREPPEGFESRIGRGGGPLWTEQKLRPFIARGLLRGAAILILDEPTLVEGVTARGSGQPADEVEPSRGSSPRW